MKYINLNIIKIGLKIKKNKQVRSKDDHSVSNPPLLSLIEVLLALFHKDGVFLIWIENDFF